MPAGLRPPRQTAVGSPASAGRYVFTRVAETTSALRTVPSGRNRLARLVIGTRSSAIAQATQRTFGLLRIRASSAVG